MPRIVLVHPQIPPNTGNIARTCAASKTELHLVGPLGFEISDRYLKRAGLDYWPLVDLHYHPDWETWKNHAQDRDGRYLGFSVRGTSLYTEFSFQDHDWLLFGSEQHGLSPDQLTFCDHTLNIQMTEPRVRSLNLSVSVAIALFEAHRQLNANPA